MIWDQCFRSARPISQAVAYRVGHYFPRCFPRFRWAALAFPILLLLLLTAAATPSRASGKNALHYGEGLIVNIPLPEPEVAQVVEEVAQNTIIRGTKEYNKDEYISGAIALTSTPVFPQWQEGGKVFYKVRKQALDPRNFKDGGDVGTLAVRYVVKPQGDRNTVLRIDALFVEDFRRSAHPSNGSVESSEYKDIQDKLGEVELVKQQTAEALLLKEQRAAKEKFGVGSDTAVLGTSSSQPLTPEGVSESAGADGRLSPAPESTLSESQPSGSLSSGSPSSPVASAIPPSPPPTTHGLPDQSLEQHVAELRQQVERLVKKPGAPLKSAPFHTASTLKTLEPGAEILILITTTYWYGVETHDGQHGWMQRDQLELVK